MKQWTEGRRLLAIVGVGLALCLGALAAIRGGVEHRGPLAGQWRVVTVTGPGLTAVDVRKIGGPLTVVDGGARFTDDINVYRATFDDKGNAEVAVSDTSASLVGRGSHVTRQQQAIDLATQTLFTAGAFDYREHGDRVTVSRGGVKVELERAGTGRGV